MCGLNQTHRTIVCCSDRHYCNDLDAYSQGIRNGLLSRTPTSKF